MLLIPIVYMILSATGSRSMLTALFGAMICSALGVALWGCRDLVLHFAEYARFERRMGEFQIYMTAGGIMMIASLMILPFLLHPKTPARTRWLLAAVMVPVGINLLFTFTRSSWLGFLAGAAVIGLRRYARAVLPMIVVVVLVVAFSSTEMRERMTSAFDPDHPNNVTRVHMWKTGFRMFADHPIVGIGDIGTEQLWDRYAEPGWPSEGHLHNNLVMWLVTLGSVGFAALIALFVSIWIRLARIEHKVKTDWVRGSIVLGALGVMAGFHVNGLFEWNFGDAEIIMLVWAVVGLSLAAEKVDGMS
jgi:O-antigen ligase